jgi:hypothetical protein
MADVQRRAFERVRARRHAERACDLERNDGGVGDVAEFDQPRGSVFRFSVCDGERQTGLARPSGSGERDQPIVGHRGAHAHHLAGAADEARRR